VCIFVLMDEAASEAPVCTCHRHISPLTRICIPRQEHKFLKMGKCGVGASQSPGPDVFPNPGVRVQPEAVLSACM